MPESAPRPRSPFDTRQEILQTRVNEVAQSLFQKGIRPTVTRVRAALGGGSPNDLTPALKHWKDTVLPTLPSGRTSTSASQAALPPQLADLVNELWQRALAAAVVQLKGGPTARDVAARTEEAQSLRHQLTGLRDQLQRESMAYGELRAQAARHEAIARTALTRASETESRERTLLREVGDLKQQLAQWKATARARPTTGNFQAAAQRKRRPPKIQPRKRSVKSKRRKARRTSRRAPPST